MDMRVNDMEKFVQDRVNGDSTRYPMRIWPAKVSNCKDTSPRQHQV